MNRIVDSVIGGVLLIAVLFIIGGLSHYMQSSSTISVGKCYIYNNTRIQILSIRKHGADAITADNSKVYLTFKQLKDTDIADCD